MNGVTTYRSERDLNESRDSSNGKSKLVKCPKCHNIGQTIVKEECDCLCAILGILMCCPLILFVPFGYGKKEIHLCRYCSNDCTKVEDYKERVDCCCCLIM